MGLATINVRVNKLINLLGICFVLDIFERLSTYQMYNVLYMMNERSFSILLQRGR